MLCGVTVWLAGRAPRLAPLALLASLGEPRLRAPRGLRVTPRTRAALADPTSQPPARPLSERGDVAVLRSPSGARLLLLGTAHVSATDAAFVREVIAAERPESVVLELDAKRLSRLNLTLEELGPAAVTPAPAPMPSGPGTDTLAPWDPRSLAAAAAAPLIRMMLTRMYNGMTARGMQAGGEFAAAIAEGQKVSARIVLGDVDSLTTIEAFLRCLACSNPFDLLRRYGTVMDEELGALAGDQELTPEVVEKLKGSMMSQPRLFDRLRDEVPEFYDTFVQARDLCLASAIAAEEEHGSRSIVAVVGLGHLQGIERALSWTREAEGKPA